MVVKCYNKEASYLFDYQFTGVLQISAAKTASSSCELFEFVLYIALGVITGEMIGLKVRSSAQIFKAVLLLWVTYYLLT